MEEGGDPVAKRGRLHCFHGDEGEVVIRPTDNTLNGGGLESSIDAVPDGDGGRGEGSAVPFDEEAAFFVGDLLRLGGRRGRTTGGGGRWHMVWRPRGW